MQVTTLPKTLQEVLYIAESTARDHSHGFIEPAHLLKAVLHKDFGMREVCESISIDYYYMLEWTDVRIGLIRKTVKKTEPVLSDASNTVLEEAENFKLNLNLPETDPLCLLAALITPGVGFTFEQLKSLAINTQDILEFASAAPGSGSGGQQVSPTKSARTNDNLSKYCTNLLADIREKEDEKIIGLDKDILTIIEVLGRKAKSNVLIVGESGVGKTSLVRGFVKKIASGMVPPLLKEAVVFELDTGSLSLGASYKGEIEDRFKKVLDDLRKYQRPILVIESIENIFEKHGTLAGIASMIKHELNKGGFILIATALVAGFTKNIETDREFSGRIEKLNLDEPSIEKTIRIIHEIIPQYEEHHQIKAGAPEIADSVRLAKRYLSEKFLPSSAIDLLDRSMALVNTMNAVSVDEINSLQQKFSSMSQTPEENESSFSLELDYFYQEINDKLSTALLMKAEEGDDYQELKTTREKAGKLSQILQELDKVSKTQKQEIEQNDLTIIISQLTGIPLGKISSKEKDKLINAEDYLKRRVCGQDHVIKTVVDAIYESRSGLNKKGQPMASFFFLGPTGTGKTELAKTLADFLFQDESNLIRFDMSEFKEEHSAALLYGAPPGYVGYEEGGLLVNKIRQKPYSVVLFDEIEKAHASVFDIFLQILDEGKLHDKLGREGDFSNALILFTSNIGSDFIFKSFENNTIPDQAELMDIMTRYFRPEFLGRLTETVPFSPITEEIVSMIFNIHYRKLVETLKNETGITLHVDEETKLSLARSGYSRQFGARPILGVIRNSLRRPLSKLIIAGKIGKGSEVKLILEKDEYKWNYQS